MIGLVGRPVPETGPETKRNVARDLLNLTLASPSANRDPKSTKDAADWLPQLYQCWFADQAVQVKAGRLKDTLRKQKTAEQIAEGRRLAAELQNRIESAIPE